MFLYYVANPIYRNDILKRGILPRKGRVQDSMHKLSRKRIFLCLTNEYDSTWDDDRYVINLPKYMVNKLRVDKEVLNLKCYYLDNIRINKKHIKLIHKGTGISTF